MIFQGDDMDERTHELVIKEGEENVRQIHELMKKEGDRSITSDELALLAHLNSEALQLAEEALSLGFDPGVGLEAARRRMDRELCTINVEEIRELGDDTAH